MTRPDVLSDLAPSDDWEREVAMWATSGGMALTGWPARAPLLPPRPVLAPLAAVAAEIDAATEALGQAVQVDVPAALFGRAALVGGERGGTTSVGGSCRLLRAGDGWVAVNLPRMDDVDAVPAVVGELVDDPWSALQAFAATRPAAALVERAALVGVPASAVGEAPAGEHGARARRLGAPGPRSRRPLLVVDLSAMWAGPLVARVLGASGARVVKVEHPARPDGARRGPPVFFDWLHAGHESVAWDFTSRSGAALLARLLGHADVVVESSRPRALRQVGIDAARLVASRRGLTWVSITAYGREEPWSDRVGFGDDTAAAARLVAADAADRPVFCGDAIADPITGLVAALAAARSVAAGGGYLLDVPLAGAAAQVAGGASSSPPIAVRARGDGRWAVDNGCGAVLVEEPRPLVAPGPAEPLGASTARVLAGLEAAAS